MRLFFNFSLKKWRMHINVLMILIFTELMYFHQKNFKTFEQDLQKLEGDLQKLHKNAQHLTITSPADTFAPRKPTFSQMVKKWLKS